MTNVALTADELENLGVELSMITTNLAMTNIALDSLSLLNTKDAEGFIFGSKQYIEHAYKQNEHFIDKLNRISFILLNSDNVEELKGVL